MEDDLSSSLQLDDSIDPDYSKYICGLSTILVATIQELKDRISQVEFIFCNQLFPNFQSRSKVLHKRLIEDRKTAEDEWKKKENFLLSQIEGLNAEKQQSQEHICQLSLSLEQCKAGLKSSEMVLQKHEYEKKHLLEKLESLEKKDDIIDELKQLIAKKTNELNKEKELCRSLLLEIGVKDEQIISEQAKWKNIHDEHVIRYKELKSQYNFLLKKCGLLSDNDPYLGRDQKNLHRHFLNKRNIHASDDEHENNQLAFESSPPKIGKIAEEVKEYRGDVLIKSSNCHSLCDESSNSISQAWKPIANGTEPEIKGGERKGPPFWINTRARQRPAGTDPHDDFLDTPMENVKNPNNAIYEQVQDISFPVPRDMDLSNSNDETQDLNACVPPRQQQISVLKPEKQCHKYVEPVRKKADRENLKGVECKQCKKFYDAVLPAGEGRDTAKDNSKNMRCEHLDGASRHRYKYAPPMTPEGFWNIGFDSER